MVCRLCSQKKNLTLNQFLIKFGLDQHRVLRAAARVVARLGNDY